MEQPQPKDNCLEEDHAKPEECTEEELFGNFRCKVVCSQFPSRELHNNSHSRAHSLFSAKSFKIMMMSSPKGRIYLALLLLLNLTVTILVLRSTPTFWSIFTEAKFPFEIVFPAQPQSSIDQSNRCVHRGAFTRRTAYKAAFCNEESEAFTGRLLHGHSESNAWENLSTVLEETGNNKHLNSVERNDENVGKSLKKQSTTRKLRIAQIAPLAESIPPKMYGGTERMVYYLTEELVRRGHQVTLFCSADSQTSAEQISHESWPAIRLNPVIDNTIPHLWMMEQVRQRADQFDILHFHTLDYFSMMHGFMNRSVTTLHGLLSFPDLGILFDAYNKVPLVSISDNQRLHLQKAAPNYVGTVHHGIPASLLPFNAQTVGNGNEQPYLAFLGRITEVKRPEWAIEIAVRARIPLKIAAKVDVVDVRFWEQTVKPLIDKHSDLVEYIGEINDSEKADFLGNALALLFPIDWHEPFGLVMIESMACGTPVLARRFGSVPEVVEHGVSGFLFDTIDEGVEAVRQIHRLDRAKVREAFEQRFTVEQMAENYLKIYEQMAVQ